MKIIQSPSPLEIEGLSYFLAGSIEMGNAVDWQQQVCDAAEGNITILNPRRKDWDSSRKNDISDERFREQVNWELTALRRPDLVLFYFDPNTKSPITLLELGLYHEKAVVCCPKGYWRKGNVDIVCEKYGIPQVEDLQKLIEVVKKI